MSIMIYFKLLFVEDIFAVNRYTVCMLLGNSF